MLPRRDIMLTASFTGWESCMRELGEVVSDPSVRFGGTVVLWDFHARQPRQVFEAPGAPLEIRWAWGEITTTPSLRRR